METKCEEVSKNESENGTVSLLTTGLLQVYQPALSEVKAELDELLCKQEHLYVDILKDKQAFFKFTDPKEMNEMFMISRIYKEKLRKIRSDMLYIHKRTGELKKKAIAIQETKTEQRKERSEMIHYEENLIAKK